MSKIKDLVLDVVKACLKILLVVRPKKTTSNFYGKDPFNYAGNYVLDENKLTPAEKAVLSYVQKYANEYSICPALIMAIIKHESNFNPNSIGDEGLAIGYMQVHWDAAYRAGYRSRRGKDKKYAKEDWLKDGLNPNINIKYGVGYLKICYKKYRSNPVYNDPLKNALSAYNLGIWPHGPDKINEKVYVEPIIKNYESYIKITKKLNHNFST